MSDVCIERIDHIYVTVSDLVRAEHFYDPVMQALGFRRRSVPISGEPHVHYFNAQMQYTIRPARSDGRADAYRAGALHHLCFQVADRLAVDEAHRRVRALGIEASTPRLYPEYRPDYYATFFADPDGIRLEIVCDTSARRWTRAHWHEASAAEDSAPALRPDDPQVSQLRFVSEPAPLMRGSLLHAADPPASGERFEPLARLGDVRIERIVSSAQPEHDPYDQAHDEWVLLIRGTARLEIQGRSVELAAGDYVLLPAHTPHRVLETSEGALWLALHADPDAASPRS